MVLITPYRPLVAPVPQTQPHQVSSKIGTVDVVGFDTTVEAPPATRSLIFEGDFPSNYKSIYNWNYDPELQFNPATMNKSFTTLNGHDAISIEWTTSCDVDDRWGCQKGLLIPGVGFGFEEGWFTFDIKLSSPFGNPKAMKLPGIVSRDRVAHTNPGDPDGGWSVRHMLHEGSANFTEDRKCHMWHYDYLNAGLRVNWDNNAPSLALNKVARIEYYFKMNTAFNVANGIIEARYDEGTATTHANPVTLRARRSDRQMYAGSESNRDSGKIPRLYNGPLFFGGNDSSFDPLVDSTVTFGYFKFEIPV